MIKCPNCGMDNENDNKFCGGCGTKLPAPQNYCPKCDITYIAYEKFCTTCGSKLVNQMEYKDKKKKEEIVKQNEETLKQELEYNKKIFLQNWDYDSVLKFQNTFTDANYQDKDEIIKYIDNTYDYNAFVSRKEKMYSEYKIDDSLAKIFKDDPNVLKYEYTCGRYPPIHANSLSELKAKANEQGLPLDLSINHSIESNKQFIINISTNHYSDELISFDYPDYYNIGNMPDDTPDYCHLGLINKDKKGEIYISIFEENSPFKPPMDVNLLNKYLSNSGYSFIRKNNILPYCFNALYKDFELGTISAKILFKFEYDKVIMVVCNVLKSVGYDFTNDLNIISQNLNLVEPTIEENKEKQGFFKKIFK